MGTGAPAPVIARERDKVCELRIVYLHVAKVYFECFVILQTVVVKDLYLNRISSSLGMHWLAALNSCCMLSVLSCHAA